MGQLAPSSPLGSRQFSPALEVSAVSDMKGTEGFAVACLVCKVLAPRMLMCIPAPPAPGLGMLGGGS